MTIKTLASIFGLTALSLTPLVTTDAQPSRHQKPTAQVTHDTITIDGVDVFYREAGPADAPTILLLHGYPTSSTSFWLPSRSSSSAST